MYVNDSGESTAPGNNGMDQSPLDDAVRHANPHHYIIGAQASLPVDAAGNPWNGSCFRLDPTRIGEILQGTSLSRNGGTYQVTPPPEGFPVPLMPEMSNEHSPGLYDLNN